MSTIVKCLRTVCVERTAQEPRTACSDELGFRKFSVRESTHFEIIDGHLLIIFNSDLPARLVANQVTTKSKFNIYIKNCFESLLPNKNKNIQNMFSLSHLLKQRTAELTHGQFHSYAEKGLVDLPLEELNDLMGRN